eukprot:EG_transcript_11956
MSGCGIVVKRCLPSVLPQRLVFSRRFTGPGPRPHTPTVRPELAPIVREHAIIEASLQAFQRALMAMDHGNGQIQANDSMMQDFALYLWFVEEFVTKLHHQKEEEVLFKALEREGHKDMAATLDSLAHEHQVLDGLHAAVKKCHQSQNTWGLQQVGLRLCAALQQHIAQENTVLLPFISKQLSDDAIQLLPQGFRQVELQYPCIELEAFACEFAGKYADGHSQQSHSPASAARSGLGGGCGSCDHATTAVHEHRCSGHGKSCHGHDHQHQHEGGHHHSHGQAEHAGSCCSHHHHQAGGHCHHSTEAEPRVDQFTSTRAARCSGNCGGHRQHCA